MGSSLKDALEKNSLVNIARSIDLQGSAGLSY